MNEEMNNLYAGSEDYDNEPALQEADEAKSSLRPLLAKRPMFQALFAEAVAETGSDKVLSDFAEYVVEPLSRQFALKAAKGGAFFQEQNAKGFDAERYRPDQSLRAHLINGFLPVYHIAQSLHDWGVPKFRHWGQSEELKRLFIAGYMLHDYTKIEDVKKFLISKQFEENEAPSPRMMPVLEEIFMGWSITLGINDFLQVIGGAEPYLHDLIYIACNTQRLKGTLHIPSLLPNIKTDEPVYTLSTQLSWLSDLIAYIARSPRELVANESIGKVLKLITTDKKTGVQHAKFVYHHVAENRGLLLNFIHNAVMDTLKNEARIPLLFAPSGVVYLERYDAPEMPPVDALVEKVVEDIRKTAGEKLISTGKGAKRGNTFLQVDDSYNDYFSLPEMLGHSVSLISRYIRNNKTPDRFKVMAENRWTGWAKLPASFPTDPRDGRADQIAEWAGFVEKQFIERLSNDEAQIRIWLLDELGIADLENDFLALKQDAAKGGGVRHWWHWAAAHALNGKALDDVEVLEWLGSLSAKLIDELPEELPKSAQANQETWDDLSIYIKRVLSIGGTKSLNGFDTNELEQYVKSKIGRGAAVCSICGSDFPTRKPAETAVAFQPGVYTQRIRIGASDNKRNLCSICAIEQLLRQLFVENLDTGSAAEGQKIRYLSFYPSYFFSPETLKLVQRAYNKIKPLRLSDSDFWRALREQEDLLDVKFWQSLEAFLLRPDDEVDEAKFKKVLRYSGNAQSTFFTVGFRNLEPSDTEAWVLPAFLAFVMSICLDIKVVASDSGVPLMLESAELPETLWFDGAHSSIQELISVSYDPVKDESKLRVRNQLDIDSLGLAHARLIAAYLIHLDSERDKRGDEHWNRFAPIAHSLCESPLYVFHYLSKQARDGKITTLEKLTRYIGYAENLFNIQGDPMLDYAKQLADLYRKFYKVNRPFQASSYNLLRPIDIVANAILEANPDFFPSEDALVGLARGQLKDRLDSSETKAFILRNKESEEDMKRFCEIFVKDIFYGVFKSDRGALRGKQLNLFRTACEVYYLDAVQQEWAARGRDADETEDDSDES